MLLVAITGSVAGWDLLNTLIQQILTQCSLCHGRPRMTVLASLNAVCASLTKVATRSRVCASRR